MRSKNIDVVIIVEHVARELDIACLIKYLLQRSGFSVEVLSLPYHGISSLKGNPVTVLAVPYCYSLGVYKTLLQRCPVTSLFNIAYEQIFQNINENLKAPKDDFAKKHVIHHAWSRHYAEYLKKYGVDPNNIFLNGNLSYALYKRPYHHYFPSRREMAEKFHLDPDKKWVFIPENYGAAFYSDDIIDEKIKKGIDAHEVLEYREFASRSLRQVIRWCARAAESGTVEIIFRPRPATSQEKMQNVFAGELAEIPPALRIIKDLTVRDWILSSDIVLSSYSTTLIEAAVAGKPIGMLAPAPFPEYLNASWYSMVPKIETFDDFARTISTPSPDTYQALRQWAEANMMSTGDPVMGVVNLLIAAKERGIEIPGHYKKRPEKNKITGVISQTFETLVFLKRKVLFRHPEIVEDYENDYFTQTDVNRRVAQWERVLG